jgi:hypothetical protein
MRDECARKGKWIGGCRFEPRYDVSEPIFPSTLKSVDRFIAEEWRRKTYIGEACVTCGKFIEREDHDGN